MVNVMLIDDHPVVRAGLRAILNTFSDVEVVMEGSTGADVDKLFTDDAPQVDAVVCDIQMPGMDGIAATKRVVEAGAMGYLLKDSPEQALHEAVLNTAAHRRTLAPEVVDLLAQRVGRPQESLSTRELEILRALSTGSSNKELAKQLFISEATVKTHLIHIFQKLGVETRTAAVTVARERKLI